MNPCHGYCSYGNNQVGLVSLEGGGPIGVFLRVDDMKGNIEGKFS